MEDDVIELEDHEVAWMWTDFMEYKLPFGNCIDVEITDLDRYIAHQCRGKIDIYSLDDAIERWNTGGIPRGSILQSWISGWCFLAGRQDELVDPSTLT